MELGIDAGEVVTLMGRNGMGKTTTVSAIMGLLPARRGTVEFDGQRVDHLPSYPHRPAGLGLVPEGRQIFPNLSVRENLVAAAANRLGNAAPWTLARTFDFLPRLAERQRNMGNQLSGGEQQMLAIGRALMTNPKLLILDEATEGLSPLLRQEIWTLPRAAQARGPGDPGDRQERRRPDQARRSSSHRRKGPRGLDRHAPTPWRATATCSTAISASRRPSV